MLYRNTVKHERNVFNGKWTSNLTLKSLLILVVFAPSTIWSIKWHASVPLAVGFIGKSCIIW